MKGCVWTGEYHGLPTIWPYSNRKIITMKSCGLPPTFSDPICDRWFSHEILRILGISAMFHHRVVHPFSSKVNPSPSPRKPRLPRLCVFLCSCENFRILPIFILGAWWLGPWSGHSLEIIPLLWLETQNWLVVSTPLKKISQLGWWHSQYMESHNPAMFQTKQKRKWNLFSSLGRVVTL